MTTYSLGLWNFSGSHFSSIDCMDMLHLFSFVLNFKIKDELLDIETKVAAGLYISIFRCINDTSRRLKNNPILTHLLKW